MHVIGQGLAAIGRLGPTLLVAALLIGAVAPPIAQAAYQILPLSAFLLTLGSFLTASLAPPETGLHWRRIALVLAWTGIGVPLLVALGISILHLPAAIHAGVLLSVLAPPVGSAAAIAAILGLRPRLALIASVTLTLAAPLSMPFFATAFGANVSIDLLHLAWRLALIIGSAALIAQAVRHWRRQSLAVLPNQSAAAGVAVTGLVIVGLATMRGVQTYWATDPAAFSLFLVAAVSLNVGLGFVGALLFAACGTKDALTVGLVSGNRNVTLAWAAAGATLPAATEAYVAACVVPVLALPLVIKSTLALHARLLRLGKGQAGSEPPSVRLPGRTPTTAPRSF